MHERREHRINLYANGGAHMNSLRSFSSGAVALVIALGGLFGALSGPAAARDLEAIISTKEIRLGWVDYPPLVIRDAKTSALSGVYIEAIEAVFAPLKIKPVWVEQTWATFAAALQSDQIDAFIGGAFGTPQRSLALSFTRPVAFMGSGVTVRKTDAEGRFKNVKSIMDFDRDGLTIVSALGSANHDWLKGHFKHAKVVGIEGMNQSQGSLEVLAGRADANYFDSFVAARDVQAHPNELVDIFAQNPLDVSPIAWAIKQNEPELLVFMNTMLEYMDANGTWLEFEDKYKEQLGGYFHLKRSYFSVGGQTETGK
jgi:polar amino acid transport system substrate-binding protein